MVNVLIGIEVFLEWSCYWMNIKNWNVCGLNFIVLVVMFVYVMVYGFYCEG